MADQGMGGELLAEYAANGAPTSPLKEFGYRNGQLLITAQNGTETTSFVTGKTLGALRSDYTGHVGMKITIGSQAVSVTGLGRIFVSGNSGTHTLKVVRASDNAVVASANLNMSGGSANQFKYASLSSAVTLAANTTYYVVSMETAGGDGWYDYWGTVVTTTAVAQVNSGIYGDGASWGLAGGVGNSYVPVDLQYTAAGAEINWLVTDQLGTPRMVLDKTGALANMKRHDYLPFGEELTTQGKRATTAGYNVADGVRQKFTSQERDTETGLDYMHARYSSSAQGRFTSADTVAGSISNPQSLNRYAYVGNNPMNFNDPTGHMPSIHSNPKPGSDGGAEDYSSAWDDPNSPQAILNAAGITSADAIVSTQIDFSPAADTAIVPYFSILYGSLGRSSSSGDVTSAEIIGLAPEISDVAGEAQNRTHAGLTQENTSQYQQVIAYMAKADLLQFVDGEIVAYGSGSSFHVTFEFLKDGESRVSLKKILQDTKIFDKGSFGLGHKKDVGAISGKEFADYRSINGVLGRRSLEVAINTRTLSGYADTDRYSFYHGLAPATAHLFLEFFPSMIRKGFE
jgi:RHS repeat-associated protein